MTSKSSFLKLQKEDIKRRIWSISLSMLAFFLLYTLVCAMRVSNYGKISGSNDWNYRQLVNFMGPNNEYLMMITIVASVVIGLSGFFYLHSRRKVDLFHSIPVRRERMFAAVYINGLLIYLVPYLINMLLCMVILSINNYMTVEVFVTALFTFGVNVIYYCLMYTVTIIALMLTGNIVVSFLGSMVFFIYGLFVTWLIETYFTSFFRSYYEFAVFDKLYATLSPIGSYVKTSSLLRDGGVNLNQLFSILIVVALTLALIAFAVFLYKKRPSESAGNAMVFEISKPIIKLALVIPISLAGGIMFMSISNNDSKGWLIFGLIFSLLISYGVVETIYNFDIRKAFSGKYYLLASALTVAVIASIFQFDLFKYDSYIPKKKNIETMSVVIYGLDNQITYYNYYGNSNRYISPQEYQLNNMKIKDFDSAYSIVEMGIEYLDESKDIPLWLTEWNEKEYRYIVRYNLKNGKEVHRQYVVPIDVSYDHLQEVFEDLDFKKGHYPIYNWEASSIQMVSSYNDFGEKNFSLRLDDKSKLLGIFKEELSALKMEEVSKTQPVAKLQFQTRDISETYYVYPSYTRTINFLKEHGFDAVSVSEKDNIEKIVIQNPNALYKDDKDKVESLQIGEKEYTSSQSIGEIYSSLVSDEHYHNNRILIDVESSINVTVTFKLDDYGNHINKWYYFRKGEIPDFVKKDIGIQ